MAMIVRFIIGGYITLILLQLNINLKHDIITKIPERPMITTALLPSIKLSNDEVKCLAENLYKEARGESQLGIILVAAVTINRREVSRLTNNLCSIVHQPSQFAWTRLNPASVPRDKLNEFIGVATTITSGNIAIPIRFKDATHFYNIEISPPLWTKGMIYLGVVGKHAFFKDPKMLAQSKDLI